PDGEWIAYMSNESGTFEVYVRPFPKPGGRWQISTGGGEFPMWSQREHALFFRGRDMRVYSVKYTAHGDSFVAGKPEPWSDARMANFGVTSTFDLAPDGQRLAALVTAADEQGKIPTHLMFLLNFADQLQRRAGR